MELIFSSTANTKYKFFLFQSQSKRLGFPYSSCNEGDEEVPLAYSMETCYRKCINAHIIQVIMLLAQHAATHNTHFQQFCNTNIIEGKQRDFFRLVAVVQCDIHCRMMSLTTRKHVKGRKVSYVNNYKLFDKLKH